MFSYKLAFDFTFNTLTRFYSFPTRFLLVSYSFPTGFYSFLLVSTRFLLVALFTSNVEYTGCGGPLI